MKFIDPLSRLHINGYIIVHKSNTIDRSHLNSFANSFKGKYIQILGAQKL